MDEKLSVVFPQRKYTENILIKFTQFNELESVWEETNEIKLFHSI